MADSARNDSDDEAAPIEPLSAAPKPQPAVRTQRTHMGIRYKYVEFASKFGSYVRQGFWDYSCYNKSLFKCRWTNLHDTALMLGMQAYGVLNVKQIKLQISLFRDVPESVVATRCYKLLCCSSIRSINESGVSCCPFKIRDYYGNLRAKIRSGENPRKLKVKAGRVVNSYPLSWLQ